MKYNDIEKLASDIILDHMEAGWMLKMDNSSWGGCEGVTFLVKGDEKLAVFIAREGGFGGPEKVSIKTSITPAEEHSCFAWCDDEAVEVVAEFWNAAESWSRDGWYVESLEEAEAAREIRYEHWRASRINDTREIARDIPAELLSLIRKRKGWKTVSANRLKIFRTRNGYKVVYIDNNGDEKKSFVVKF